MAFDRYAIAATVVKNGSHPQLSYKTCMLHKATVLEVASGSYSEGRKPLLGVIYDEMARYI